MERIFDLTKKGTDLVVDLINHSTGNTFKPGELVFSTPQPSETAGKTSIIISGSPNSGFGTPVKVDYTRLRFEDYFGSGVLAGTYDNRFVVDKAVYKSLLELFGVLIEKPVVDSNFVLKDHNVDFTITAQPWNLVWEGTLKGHFTRQVSLENLIGNVELDGFRLEQVMVNLGAGVTLPSLQ